MEKYSKDLIYHKDETLKIFFNEIEKEPNSRFQNLFLLESANKNIKIITLINFNIKISKSFLTLTLISFLSLISKN